MYQQMAPPRPHHNQISTQPAHNDDGNFVMDILAVDGVLLHCRQGAVATPRATKPTLARPTTATSPIPADESGCFPTCTLVSFVDKTFGRVPNH